MKFTEEQYREIIKAWDDGCDWGEAVNNVINTVRNMRNHTRLRYGEALGLGNPATREYARKQYVEKEKKYVWRCEGNSIAKIGGEWCLVDEKRYGRHLFTETEIKNSPFKPEWFEKEEV